MASRTRTGIVLLALVHGLVACDSAGPKSPGGPSDVPQPIGESSPPLSGSGQIRGLVKDTAFRPLGGAMVEVIAGLGTGTSTITDREGRFALAGVFDNTTRFRASKEDHVASTTTSPAAGGWISFHLAVFGPPANMAGDYTLTFIADSACTGLPEALRTRTYAATITSTSDVAGWAPVPPNTVFDLALSGATVQGNGIATIGIAGELTAFALFNDGLPYIVEEVAPKVFVAITGYAEMSGLPTGSTAFSGWIAHLDHNPLAASSRPRTTFASCESKSHLLIWTRR